MMNKSERPWCSPSGINHELSGVCECVCLCACVSECVCVYLDVGSAVRPITPPTPGSGLSSTGHQHHPRARTRALTSTSISSPGPDGTSPFSVQRGRSSSLLSIPQVVHVLSSARARAADRDGVEVVLWVGAAPPPVGTWL